MRHEDSGYWTAPQPLPGEWKQASASSLYVQRLEEGDIHAGEATALENLHNTTSGRDSKAQSRKGTVWKPDASPAAWKGLGPGQLHPPTRARHAAAYLHLQAGLTGAARKSNVAHLAVAISEGRVTDPPSQAKSYPWVSKWMQLLSFVPCSGAEMHSGAMSIFQVLV